MKLPQTISPDGREIWDWATNLSRLAYLNHKRRELIQQINSTERECGSCSKWMTRHCPREVSSTNTGYTTGPSMGAMICQQFVMSKQSDGLIAKWKEELKNLEMASVAFDEEIERRRG